MKLIISLIQTSFQVMMATTDFKTTEFQPSVDPLHAFDIKTQILVLLNLFRIQFQFLEKYLQAIFILIKTPFSKFEFPCLNLQSFTKENQSEFSFVTLFKYEF